MHIPFSSNMSYLIISTFTFPCLFMFVMLDQHHTWKNRWLVSNVSNPVVNSVHRDQWNVTSTAWITSFASAAPGGGISISGRSWQFGTAGIGITKLVCTTCYECVMICSRQKQMVSSRFIDFFAMFNHRKKRHHGITIKKWTFGDTHTHTGI